MIPRYQLQCEMPDLIFPFGIDVRDTGSNESVAASFGRPPVMHQTEGAIVFLREKDSTKQNRLGKQMTIKKKKKTHQDIL